MGVWNADGGPAGGDWFSRLEIFDGRVFAFAQSGGGNSGVWERTAPAVWTQRTPFGDGPGCVWRGQMFQVITATDVYSSTDGIAWVLELSLFGIGAIDAINGHPGSNYLWITYRDGVNTYFARRSPGGAWTAVPAMSVADPTPTYDIIEYGGYVYWSQLNNDIRYWVAGAWVSVPTVAGMQGSLFTVYDGMLFLASAQQEQVWRLLGSTWKREFDAGALGYDINYGHLCIGDDGLLYMAIYTGGNITRIYVRMGGRWILQGTHNPSLGDCAIIYDGDMYFGSHGGGGGECYLYAPSFAVSPVGGGCPPQGMDCDADGDVLYIGVYDAAGFPILVKATLPMLPDLVGVSTFAPGAGSAINVKCSGVGGRLAVSGRFSVGGNDSVQVSDDGGVTWTDVAPAWADTAQPLLVDPDGLNEMAIALDAAADIYDTEDGGTTWTQRNAAVGYSPGAMARLADGDELVIGNDAANRIDYSPNKGQNLTDITGVFAGNVAAIEVV